MPALKSCPPVEALSDFLLGKLDEASRESIAGHVEGCDNCLSRLDEVDQTSDSLVHVLRQPPVDDEFMREPECQLAVQRSQQLAHELGDKSEILRDYELVKKLGEGGMGTVYRALHKKLDKWVALKLLPSQRLQNAEAVSRFEREMRAIGRLHHPNIVQAHDAGEADGQHYLVMELVEGMDLATMVRRVGPLPIADACEIVRQVALGLQHAHESDLVHRDIKPSNVMLTAAGEVKILDLGLARLEDPLAGEHEVTSTGQIMGTLDYMAPEQLGDSHAVDHRADIYSLGATLYKLLTGQPPYAEQRYNTPQKKLMAIATKPIESAVDLRENIPPDLAHDLDRMIAKNPDERSAAASEIAAALARFTDKADLVSLFSQASQASDLASDSKQAPQSTFDPIASSFTDTDAGSVAESVSSSTPTPEDERRRPPWILATALSLLIVAAALTVFYVRSGEATLVVEVDDDQVAVELKRDGLFVRDKKTGREYQVWTVGETRFSPGDYEVDPGGQLMVTDDAGMKVKTRVFKLTRRGREVVKVAFDDEVAKSPPKQRSGSEDEPIDPEPLPVGTGQPMRKTALVSDPEPVPGAISWTIETTQPRGGVYAVEYSPDGSLLACGSQDGLIRIFDPETGALERVLIGERQIDHLDWSPNGQYLAAAALGQVWVWDTTSGTPVKTITNSVDYKNLACWSLDGSTLAFPMGNDLAIWHQETDEIRRLPGHSNRITYLDWAPNGEHLATASRDNTIRIWDTSTWTTSGILEGHGEEEFATAICWTSNGSGIFSTTESGLWIWSVHDASQVDDGDPTLVSKLSRSNGQSLSPDGKTLAIVRGLYEIVLLDTVLREVTRVIERHEGAHVSSIAWSPDGKTLACGHRPGTVHLHDVNDGKQVRSITETMGFVEDLAWSPAGELIAIKTLYRRKVSVLNCVSGELVYRCEGGDGSLGLHRASFLL